MPRVEETLEISIVEEGLDAKQIEAVVARERREFQKPLMIRLLGELEKAVLKERGRGVV